MPAAHTTRLTRSGAKILVLLAGGLSNKEIASQLGLAEGTVRTQATTLVYRPLGVTNRFEAGLWALRHLDLLRDVK